jgi:putative mRNA 3-end processing factor
MPLIEHTDRGLFCRRGNFYIDPWKPVHKALITHAHSDHARPGNDHYLCHTDTLALLRLRLGELISCQVLPWNVPLWINGVKVSLHPAGHIIGSSQVRVEYNGEIWVVSGDYKVEDDGLSGAFEPVPCHCFITESTFGLPIYRWKPQREIFSAMEHWIRQNQQEAVTSVLLAYSLGKAQRLIAQLGGLDIPLFVHGAIWNAQTALKAAGWIMPTVRHIAPDTPKEAFKGQVVIAPPSADDSLWLKKFLPYSLGVCSGWMQVRGNTRRRNADAGFALSDHADWPGLLSAVKATGAAQVLVTHGFQSAFSRYLSEQGLQAAEVHTAFGETPGDALGEEDALAAAGNRGTGDALTEIENT